MDASQIAAAMLRMQAECMDNSKNTRDKLLAILGCGQAVLELNSAARAEGITAAEAHVVQNVINSGLVNMLTCLVWTINPKRETAPAPVDTAPPYEGG